MSLVQILRVNNLAVANLASGVCGEALWELVLDHCNIDTAGALTIAQGLYHDRSFVRLCVGPGKISAEGELLLRLRVPMAI